MAGRLDVRKTYKLYVGGKFPRSESGRSYEVTDANGRFLANAARASRKDTRDAVQAARAAVAGWSAPQMKASDFANRPIAAASILVSSILGFLSRPAPLANNA